LLKSRRAIYLACHWLVYIAGPFPAVAKQIIKPVVCLRPEGIDWGLPFKAIRKCVNVYTMIVNPTPS
jgi:hypothetical protein